ncbi:hypothetical protein Tco_0202127, partial [Tanacetum coccineum]
SSENCNSDFIANSKIAPVSKDADETLAVNRVRSKRVDLRKGEMVVHVMDGVIMEAEFEQSVRPNDDEED